MNNKKQDKVSFFRRLKGFFLLIRPLNLFIIALTAFLTWYALLGGIFDYLNMPLHMNSGTMLLLIISMIGNAAGGYIINDYFDIPIDQVNKPDKQIVGILISPQAAIYLYAFFTLGGLVAGFLAALNVGNYQLGMVYVIFALALWFYSDQFKYLKFWGNFIVSLSTAFIVVVVWLFEFFAMIAETEFLPPREQRLVTMMILAYGTFAFLSTFVRELVKDRQDVPGDLRAGVRSLAVTMSDTGFKVLLFVILTLNIILLIFSQIWLSGMNLMYITWFIYLLEALIIYTGWLIYKARCEQDYAAISLYLKVYIVAGILSMQIMQISW